MKALILLSSLGVIALLAEIFSFKKFLYPLVLMGLVITFAINLTDWNTGINYFNMMLYDNYAVAFTSAILAIAFLWFLMSDNYFKEETSRTDHFALVLFALAGAVIMVSYSNMTMLFLGIEILSISMYVLAGSKKDDLNSNESAFKYLIMGAFATGFLLFGIALIYGATGSFNLNEIKIFITIHQGTVPSVLPLEKGAGGLFYAGVLMMLIGLSFKVSAAPFHFWAPDVYQGAPTVITAFMATVVKTAAFATFLRLFSTTFANVSDGWVNIVWVMAALTLLVGNITAVVQTSTKRMLAYSSVAHAGYMLLALLAGNSYSNSAILFYATAYSIGSIGTFCILNIVTNAKETSLLSPLSTWREAGGEVDSFNGLGKSNPFLAFVMTIALLSLAGIPPTAGFFAKYYIFTSAFQSGYPGLVLIAIFASLVGVYYYFRIIIAMYFKTSALSEIDGMVPEKIVLQTNHKILLIVIAAATIALGLFPDFIIRLL